MSYVLNFILFILEGPFELLLIYSFPLFALSGITMGIVVFYERKLPIWKGIALGLYTGVIGYLACLYTYWWFVNVTNRLL